MAQKVTVVDDLTGEDGAETVLFALEGQGFEVDLTEASLKQLRSALEPFIKVARPAGASAAARRGRPRGTTTKATDERVDYTDTDRYGQLHRGRLTDEEIRLVQENPDKASANREAQGHPPIDWNDPKERARYQMD